MVQSILDANKPHDSIQTGSEEIKMHRKIRCKCYQFFGTFSKMLDINFCILLWISSVDPQIFRIGVFHGFPRETAEGLMNAARPDTAADPPL